jgi:Glycosyl hydrolase family 115
MKKQLMVPSIAGLLFMLAGCKCPVVSDVAKTTSSGVVINASTPWVISEGEPEAVQRTLEDVATDWYKVFGRRPVIVREVPASYKGPVIYMGSTGAWRDDLVRRKPAGRESFLLRIQKDGAGRPALVGTGSDMRGSIYAAYAFSEEILGVDPWYYWVDKEPLRRGQIEIPATFDKSYGPPTFKYRGWFINDEDLLARYSPDPLRENVFSLEALDRICETLLRLRGNMIVPATFAFPDERCNELAARRGLVLNMHHILVLGLNTFQWPKDVPFSYNKHPEIMEKYWQTCVDAYKKYEVVWSVGYRGKGDQPFWTNEKDMTDPVQRGDVITRAIAKQVELVRKVNPDADIIANMWSEGAEMVHQGLIKLPKGVTLVWPDKGNGMIQDNGQVKAGQGIYYHTAMLNGRCNQLTEMVNPGRIYNQVGRFVKAGATTFFLVNVSDIRPVPLSTDCAMKLAWNAEPYMGKTDAQNMLAFYKDWSARQFGVDVGGEVSEVYKGYFNCPYMSDELLLGENYLQCRLRILFDKAMPLIKENKPLSEDVRKRREELFALSSEGLPHMEKLLKQAEQLLPLIPADRRDFYRSHVILQIQIHLFSLGALKTGCQALMAYESGDKTKAVSFVETQLQIFDKIYPELHKAEYGKWAAWFEGECFLGLERTRIKIADMLAALKGEPEPVKPYRWEDYSYEDLYRYQTKNPENFPLLYPKK